MKSKLLPSKAELAAAKRAGRHGDTDLIHANKREEAILAAMGGAGTRNPRTGLLEFYSDSANEHSRAETGHNMADHSRPGDMSGTAAGGSGARGSGYATGSPIGGATNADKQIEDKYLADPTQNVPNDRSYWDAVGNLGKRYADYKDLGNSTLEDIGNFLAGGLGVGEIDPTKQPLGAGISNPRASWGIDPVKAGLGVAGLFSPFGTLAGMVYSGAKKLTGWDGPMVSFDGTGYAGSPIGNGSPASSGATPDQHGGKAGESTGTYGNYTAPPPIPGAPNDAPKAPESGATLPPITAPTQAYVAGAPMQIPGASPYGWTRPGWYYPT
jgi:hypothetical protein